MKFLKTIIFSGIAILLVAILISRLGHYAVTADLPEFLDEMTESAKNSTYVKSKIGDYTSYEYTFNKKDLKKDTLKFNITVIGDRATLTLNGFALKKADEWVPIRTDSSFLAK